MRRSKTVLVLATAAALGLGGLAHAHGTGSSQSNHPYGWHMGPMMGQGQMGPGMMGRGQMGPMMGQGQMGPGMMGREQMGPMMGQGQMGMRPLLKDMTVEDVTHVLEHQLAWNGNPNIKVGDVTEKDDDTIIADIVTKDGSLVERLTIDRHTGYVQPVR